MIGDGWNGDNAAMRPEHHGTPEEPTPRRVAVITGSRAEFGLLAPVMLAIAANPSLQLMVIAAGSHLVAPAETFYDVKALFNIAEVVPMQICGRVGRAEDVESLARGVARFGRSFEKLRPQWVVVLGDRIEAFAAGIAANIGGYALAHIHGGDRAEGIADESMRHALTKLAHLHFPATELSAERIIKMGEQPRRILMVGSPAIDGLSGKPSLDDVTFDALGRPTALFLMHPVGRSNEMEEAGAAAVLEGLAGERVAALHPNFDPGREGVLRAIVSVPTACVRSHIPRDTFVGLLKRLAGTGGVLVGNSSAGLIEAAAIGLKVIDIGTRQQGRERPGNVIHIENEYAETVGAALRRAKAAPASPPVHPYGEGRASQQIADALARVDMSEPGFQRKRITY